MFLNVFSYWKGFFKRRQCADCLVKRLRMTVKGQHNLQALGVCPQKLSHGLEDEYPAHCGGQQELLSRGCC